jgi:hypothetical protein
LTFLQQRFDRGPKDGLLALDQHAQHLIHPCFAFVGRQVKNLQVFPVRPRRQRFVQPVVGQAEAAGGKQFCAVAVVRQRPGLADQGVNHVPIVDVLFVPSVQPRQCRHQLLGIPDFQVLQVNPHFHLLTDQPTVHRVDVVLHVDQAAARYRHIPPLATLQPPRRQRSQHDLFLGQALRPADVALPPHVLQESHVLFPAGKVPAATQ